VTEAALWYEQQKAGLGAEFPVGIDQTIKRVPPFYLLAKSYAARKRE
jgi:hypothetical protein